MERASGRGQDAFVTPFGTNDSAIGEGTPWKEGILKKSFAFSRRRVTNCVLGGSLAFSAVAIITLLSVFVVLGCFRQLFLGTVQRGDLPRLLASGGAKPKLFCGGAAGGHDEDEDDGGNGKKWDSPAAHNVGKLGEGSKASEELEAYDEDEKRARKDGWGYRLMPSSLSEQVLAVFDRLRSTATVCQQISSLASPERVCKLVKVLTSLAAVDLSVLARVPSELDHERQLVVEMYLMLVVRISNNDSMSKENLAGFKEYLEKLKRSWDLTFPRRAATYKSFTISKVVMASASNRSVHHCLKRIRTSIASPQEESLEDVLEREQRILDALLDFRVSSALQDKGIAEFMVGSQPSDNWVIFSHDHLDASCCAPAIMPVKHQLQQLYDVLRLAGEPSHIPQYSPRDSPFDILCEEEKTRANLRQHLRQQRGSASIVEGGRQGAPYGRDGQSNRDALGYPSLPQDVSVLMTSVLSQLCEVAESLSLLKEYMRPIMYSELLKSVTAVAVLELGVISRCPENVEFNRHRAIQKFMNLLSIRYDVLSANMSKPETVDMIEKLRALLRVLKSREACPLLLNDDAYAGKFRAQLNTCAAALVNVEGALSEVQSHAKGSAQKADGKASLDIVFHTQLRVLEAVLKTRVSQILRSSFARYPLVEGQRKIDMWVLFSREDLRKVGNAGRLPSAANMQQEIERAVSMAQMDPLASASSRGGWKNPQCSSRGRKWPGGRRKGDASVLPPSEPPAGSEKSLHFVLQQPDFFPGWRPQQQPSQQRLQAGVWSSNPQHQSDAEHAFTSGLPPIVTPLSQQGSLGPITPWSNPPQAFIQPTSYEVACSSWGHSPQHPPVSGPRAGVPMQEALQLGAAAQFGTTWPSHGRPWLLANPQLPCHGHPSSSNLQYQSRGSLGAHQYTVQEGASGHQRQERFLMRDSTSCPAAQVRGDLQSVQRQDISQHQAQASGQSSVDVGDPQLARLFLEQLRVSSTSTGQDDAT